MKDEIKEILDYLKDNDNYIEDIGGEHKRIGLYEAKILLDYITNLQEENEVLKRNKNMIFDANCNLSKVMNNYKTRIDEAIELINQNICGGSISNANELINLLQGKSDE